MGSFALAALWVLPYCVCQVSAIYNPLREYAGDTFFDKFAFYGNVDNTTWGNVTFLDEPTAKVQGLTFINGAGNAIVKVDNTTTIAPAPVVNRGSIRLTSLDSYGMGSLIIIDAVHIPFGCSVWPSFWTYGIEEEWPIAGEIDIIEAINGMDHNQVALHTTPGCFQAKLPPGQQTGTTLETDCSVPRGCIVAETKPNSYGPGFAAAGGGVYAVQIASSGVFTWFWSRPDIPANLLAANSTSQIDTIPWGIPSSAYPNTDCNIEQFFPPQNLVLLTTLCGVWAGVPSIYSSSCHTPTNDCVADNVIGNGSNYADAYWEIRYIRTYLADDAPPSNSSATSLPTTTTTPQTDVASPSATITSITTVTSSIPTPSTSTPSSSTSMAVRFSQLAIAISLILATLSFLL